MDVFLTTFYIILSSQLFVPGKYFEYEYKLEPSVAVEFGSMKECRQKAESFIKSLESEVPKQFKLVYVCKDLQEVNV